MNIDVEFHIRHNYPWARLPASVRQVRAAGLPARGSGGETRGTRPCLPQGKAGGPAGAVELSVGTGGYGMCTAPVWGKGAVCVCVCMCAWCLWGEGDKKTVCAVCVRSEERTVCVWPQ